MLDGDRKGEANAEDGLAYLSKISIVDRVIEAMMG
jgi:hypothetical protein